MKDGVKPKDTESQEESETESKTSLKIKDENSRELNSSQKKRQKLIKKFFSFLKYCRFKSVSPRQL